MITLENLLKNTLKSLSDNMMFRLSLTSKELFHSNFWAWLLEEYPSSAKVFYADFNLQDKISNVLREKSHTDLSFCINDELVIIENKFKSFPDLEQLKKYAKGHSNLKRMILISYYKPLFLNAYEKGFTHKYTGDSEVWFYQDDKISFELEFISYNVLCGRLLSFIGNIAERENKIFIKNYIQMLELLIQLKNDLSLKNHPDKTYGEFISMQQESNAEAKKINFDSVVKKIFFHELLLGLLEDTKYYTLPLKNVGYSDRAQNVYMGLMFGVDDAADKTIDRIGIELCGNQYRKYIQANKDYEGQDRKELEIQIELSPKYRWFYECCHGRNINDNSGFWGYNYEDHAWLYKICDEVNIMEMNFTELKTRIMQEMENIERNIKVKNETQN